MQLVPEMTALEYRTRVAEFLPTVGIKAELYTSMNDRGPLFHAALYANGITQRTGGHFRVHADAWSELFEALTTKWAEYEAQHRTETIRKMALAIIRITAELGECTDAALRNCGEFDPGQVKAYGEQACADANEIAGKGPFSIVVMGGANAEAA